MKTRRGRKLMADTSRGFGFETWLEGEIVVPRAFKVAAAAVSPIRPAAGDADADLTTASRHGNGKRQRQRQRRKYSLPCAVGKRRGGGMVEVQYSTVEEYLGRYWGRVAESSLPTIRIRMQGRALHNRPSSSEYLI